MTVLSHTEEDVELGEVVLLKAREDGCGWKWAVKAILDDLAARGRLVPPGSEVREGRCGDEAPTLTSFGRSPADWCVLRAGHLGWHESDSGSSWTHGDVTDGFGSPISRVEASAEAANPPVPDTEESA